MRKTPISLQDLRRGIYVKAKADTTWRFWGLYVHVCKPETLRAAYALAKENDGAPGIDGVTFEAIEAGGVEGFLEQLGGELVARTYRPLRNRRHEIPQEGGRVRVLGIPAIRDRVVQGALKLILEPIFEADFHEGSYGYRPKRSAAQALARVVAAIGQGKTRVLDLDLAAYFDTVRHDLLLGKVARRVQDGEILHLLKLILKATGKRGVPQGGGLTPPTQSQTSSGTGWWPTGARHITELDMGVIGSSIVVTHGRSATCASRGVRPTGQSSGWPLGAVSPGRRAAQARPAVPDLAPPGPPVRANGPGASDGAAGPGAHRGLHREAAGERRAAGPGARPGHGGEPERARDARAHGQPPADAGPIPRWGVGASRSSTSLTAWRQSG